jgi:hypothetical protein
MRVALAPICGRFASPNMAPRTRGVQTGETHAGGRTHRTILRSHGTSLGSARHAGDPGDPGGCRPHAGARRPAQRPASVAR